MRPALETAKYAVIYPRQSSQDQVENNVYSLERQMQLKEIALRDGFPPDQVLVVDDDLGMSGRSIEGRPGFSRALKMINQGLVAAIYVEDLTRLSRDERTIDQMIIADACERSGTLVYMGRSWYDMRDAGQRQSYKYQAVGASEYWKAHMTKLHENHRWKAMQGKAACQVPRGYRAKKDVPRNHPERDRYIVHEAEAEVIRAIASKLSEAGTVRNLFRMIHPTYWPDGQVVTWPVMSRLLTSPTYRGTLVWGSVTVENAHEAIIGPELAAEIDDIIGYNRCTRRRPGGEDRGVLSSVIHCATCRRKLYNNSTGGASTYTCTVVDKLRKVKTHFTIRTANVDRMVLEDLWARLDPGLAEAIVAQMKERRTNHGNMIDLGQANRKSLQRKIDGFTKSLADPDLGDMARKILVQQLDQTARILEALDRQAPSAPIDCSTSDFDMVRRDPDVLQTLQATWDEEPLEWRRKWVRRFIERIELRQRFQGRHDITVRYRDGNEVSYIHRQKTALQDDELQAVVALWQNPERPAWGWNKWILERLTAQGFEFTRRRLYCVIKIAKDRELVRSCSI